MDAQPEIAPSRHKCLIYEGDPSEQLPVVVPLLLDGLEEHWRCLYLGSPESVRMVESALDARGVDTKREIRRGALVLSSDRSHLQGGRFDPQAMIDRLCASIDEAVGQGFGGLCATGDMRWELGADENFARLLEYEALLEQLFRDRPLRGICQYHRDLIPPEAMQHALLAHRSAFVGGMLESDNLFYVPPELLHAPAEPAAAARRGEWMCRQILRVLKAERARDEALAAQRRLSERLAEMNRDLERRVAERTAELAAVNRHLETFAYSISHDLRAPLRSIRGFGQILAEDGDLHGEGREHLDRILAGSERMEQLIDGLLAMGRIVSAPLRRVPLDLTALARELVRELREADPSREVQVDIQEGLVAEGDQVLVRAVMTNLLANAWKFTSKRAQASVEVRQAGEIDGQAVFFVRDNGAGFDMAYAQKLFGVFQRMHGREDFPGTGVGLATVERIVQRHGGAVWADAAPDQGATFYFTLPAPQPDGPRPPSRPPLES